MRQTVDSPLEFCIARKDKPYEYVTEIKRDSTIIVPDTQAPWVPPRQPTSFESLEKLWNDIRVELYNHIDLTDKRQYDVLTGWIFASWLPEKWSAIGYLNFLGFMGTGKTRIMEVLARMSMRGYVDLNATAATLYRPLERWHHTVFFDEAENYREKAEINGILNGGYKQGSKVTRHVEVNGDYETRTYDVYGFKGFAGTEELKGTLQSRCIIVRTSYTSRPIRFSINVPRLNKLRDMLLKMRFDHFFNVGFVGYAGFEGDINYIDDNNSDIMKDLDDRDKEQQSLVSLIGNYRETELYFPIISLAPTQTLRDKLLAYAKSAATVKIEDFGTSPEVNVILALLLAKKSGYCNNDKIPVNKLNDILLEMDEIWNIKNTRSLCKTAGFNSKRIASGWVILWNEDVAYRYKNDPRFKFAFNVTPKLSMFKPKNSTNDTNPTQNWTHDNENCSAEVELRLQDEKFIEKSSLKIGV